MYSRTVFSVLLIINTDENYEGNVIFDFSLSTTMTYHSNVIHYTIIFLARYLRLCFHNVKMKSDMNEDVTKSVKLIK